ncbi:hypothetical protein GCM10010198_12630 [Nocardia seriolae]|nr:hypothetical protein NSERKGN1266_12850 [Nocardia seriolae]
MPGGARAVLQGAVQAAEGVAEGQVVTHVDGQVVELVAHGLEEQENSGPVLEFRVDPDVLEGRIDVEGHDIGREHLLQGLEVFGPQPFDHLAELPADLGLIGRAAVGAGPEVIGNRHF